MIFIALTCTGQSSLSLKEAIRLGLEQQLEIAISRNEMELAKDGNTAGMAGFLPSAVLNLGSSYQNSNINQRFASGLEVERSGVSGSGLNGALAVNWLFFDGGKMFVTRKKLARQLSVAEIRLQNQIMASADSIAASYYQIVLSDLELKVLEESRKSMEERLRIANEQQKAGTRPPSDAMQASMDLLQLENRIIAQKKQIEIRKAALNLMTGREPDVDFVPSDSIQLPEAASYQLLKSSVLEKNLGLRTQRENLEVSRLGIKELKSRLYPQAGLNLSLNYQRNRNSAGFALYNRNIGPFAGINFSMPLFNGVSVNQQLKMADRDLNGKSLQLKLTENRLLFQLWRGIKNLETWLENLEIEKKILALAIQNERIIRERYQMGLTSSLELRVAEGQLESARLRIQQCRFQARITGNQLLRLSAELKPESVK